MKKIAVITGTRAEFGLLKPLLRAIREEDSMDLQLVVTAMHLSPEFGYTAKEIEESGFKINKKIECLLSSDSATGVTKSIGLAAISFAEAFEELSPDIIIILGDRTEMLAAATAGIIANLPIAHLHGGETTEGAYDEAIRHAITKMSYWHFAATETYRRRIIQLGEDPERVFNVGAIGLDSIKDLQLLSKEEFEKQINFSLGAKNILITFHPVTFENHTAQEQFQSILDALDSLEDTQLIFTHANSDKYGAVINEMIEEFVSPRKKAISFKSLGHKRYLSALQYVDMTLGNSSSGIIEVPYFKIPSINIGERQKGRIVPESVIQCKPKKDEILKAIKKAYNPDFLKTIRNQEPLYGKGNTVEQVIKILSGVEANGIKKSFYDVSYEM